MLEFDIPIARVHANGTGLDGGDSSFQTARRPNRAGRLPTEVGAFFIFIFKKIKFQKYMPNREIFKNECVSPP